MFDELEITGTRPREKAVFIMQQSNRIFEQIRLFKVLTFLRYKIPVEILMTFRNISNVSNIYSNRSIILMHCKDNR